MRFALCVLACAGVAALSAAPAAADVKIKLEEVASGLTHPLAMVSFPDGSGRKAVIEQTGQVRIIDGRGRLLPDPFLNIESKIVRLHHFFDERGLLGIAFHPNYRRTASSTSPILRRCAATQSSTKSFGTPTPTRCPR